MKIGLAAAAILLLATLGLYGAISRGLTANAIAEVEANLIRAEKAFSEIGRLRAADAAMQAFVRAKRPSVVAVFGKTDETARREAAYAECQALNAGLAKEGRQASIVAIIGADGKVIARDINPNALWGEDFKSRFPAVANALAGEPVKDVWTMDGRMTQVALGPITRSDGSVLGALLIGHALSVKLAQETRDRIGSEIGYFHAGKMQASSYGTPNDPEKEDVSKTQALGGVLFGEQKLAEQALSKGGPSELVRFRIEGREYAAIAAPLQGNQTDRTSGVVLSTSVADAVDRVRGLSSTVLTLGILGILILVAAVALTARRFIRPLDQIELGVAEIINGNIDYTFRPVGPDFEGLSNGLNVMLARLLGREEPNEDAVQEEDDDAGKAWRADQMIIEEGDGAPTPAAAALAQEGEAAYYPRLFNEYVAALRSKNRPSQGISVPAVMAKLRLAEAGLKQKWSCKMVRFQLISRGDDLVFRAVRID
ncbi:MAG TPA: cache domain-containing protein [Polyangia bacterium]